MAKGYRELWGEGTTAHEFRGATAEKALARFGRWADSHRTVRTVGFYLESDTTDDMCNTYLQGETAIVTVYVTTD